MSTLKRCASIALCAAILCCLSLIRTHAKPPHAGGGGGASTTSYSVVVLDSREGYADDINNVGAAVGAVFTEGNGTGPQPYYWLAIPGRKSTSVVSVPLSLNGSGGNFGEANGITDTDSADPTSGAWICGNAWTTDGPVSNRALVWDDPANDPLVLPLGSNGTAAWARAINNNGLVVGFRTWTVDGVNGQSAAVWGVLPDGTVVGPVDLGAGYAFNVNDSGLIVGRDRRESGGDFQATWWQVYWDGVDLALLDAGLLVDSTGLANSAALGVNNAGYTCGILQEFDSPQEAFVLDSTLTPQVLAPLVDDDSTYTLNTRATAVNNLETPQVLGSAWKIDRKTGASLGIVPVLWQGTSVIDLRAAVGSGKNVAATPSWDRLESINDSSWIAGQGNASGVNVPIVMIPK